MVLVSLGAGERQLTSTKLTTTVNPTIFNRRLERVSAEGVYRVTILNVYI